MQRQERRYTTGLLRLEEAASSVGAMQRELVNLQPVLATKTREVADKVAMVERRRGEVAEVRRRGNRRGGKGKEGEKWRDGSAGV